MTGKLETRLLNYFLLIAFAAMLIGVEFFFEMNRSGLSQEICRIAEQQSGDGLHETGTTASSSPLSGLRNKIVIMFGVLTLVVAIVMTMFIKNITMPLCKMANVARRINEGDLSQIVPVESEDEIGQVGTAINELTSNLQEVTAFAATTAMETLNKINVLSDTIKSGSSSPKELKEIKRNLESLIEFVDSFKLLHTDIT